MGVLGLWQLLAPVGQPVTLESLENKIFAVDISIWLNQALKGYRDSQGGSVANAHLLSLFSRLCKLLYYKIRPIIVFDGGFPELKKQTIINRNKRRAAVKQSSRDIGLKILSNYLASQNLANVTGESSSKNSIIRPKEKVRDEIFMLPPLPTNSQEEEDGTIDSVEWKFTNFTKEDIRYLNKIDIESDDFNNLPPDMKQEILSTLKESRRHKTWEQHNELPEDSNEFSSYQMQCLLKKRLLSRKLEEVQKDIRQINSADFVAQYTSDHVIGETNKIMSDDCSHYVLLKKIIQKQEHDDGKTPNTKCGSSSMLDIKNVFIKDMENIDVNDYSENKNNISQNFENKIGNFKTETTFDSNLSFDNNEEDIDNPPMYMESDNMNISPKKSNVVQPESLQKTADSIQSSDEDEVALAIQMSFEQSNQKNGNIHSSLHQHNDKLKSTSKTNKTADESLEILSQKLEPSIQKISVPLPTDTVCLSSSDDEMIPCESMDSETELIHTNIVSDNKDVKQTVSHSEVKEPSNELENSLVESSTAGACTTSEVIVDVSTPNSELVASCPSTPTDQTVSHLQNGDVSKKDLRIQKDPKSSVDDQLIESHPSTSSSQPLTPQQKAEIAQMNMQLQEDLESATALLEANQAKQDRQNRTVQEHMIEECKELLQLFGVPFVVSPTEAEAQCAFYDSANLTHGTITDDSDVWLFGGKRVYKNFFTQQKYVEFYKDHEIFTHFGLSRKKLVNFAMLTGSDYTEGIEGVGPVRAMEILSEFPGDGIEALYEFKEWWTSANKHALPPENKVRERLQKLVLNNTFPDDRIHDAYLNPAIDYSTEKFTWGRPDLDALRDYTRERFGWNKSKVDDAVLPVIKKLSERDSQTHLDSFFTVTLKKQTNLFPSKRIMSALKKLTSPQKESCNKETDVKDRKRKTKGTARKAAPKKKTKTASKKSSKCEVRLRPRGPVLSEESSDES